MDGISAAASAFAVASLAIQLLESAIKIHDFFKRCKNGSDQLDNIVADLALLQTVFRNIINTNQLLSDGDGLTAIYIVLERFQRQIKPMEAFISGLKIDFSTRPRRAALKTALSKSKIEEFRTQLEVSKTAMITSLCLINLLSQQECHKTRTEQLENLRCTIVETKYSLTAALANASTTESISQERHSIGRSSNLGEMRCETLNSKNFYIDIENLFSLGPNSTFWPYVRLCRDVFGSIQYRTQRKIVVSAGAQHSKSTIVEYQKEHRTLAMVLPLSRWVVMYRSCMVYGQWTRSLRFSQVISLDSPIWHMCSEGNIVGMRRLFEAGLASPYDLSPFGQSLLHFAVDNENETSVDIVKWLLELGLDSNLYYNAFFWDNTPFLCLVPGIWDDPSLIQTDIAIKIARLFLTKDDFNPGDDDFGRVASLYGTKMIEWFIYQDYHAVSQKNLDRMLELCCWRIFDPNWEKVVKRLLKSGAYVHARCSKYPSGAQVTLLGRYLEHHMDADRWLRVLQDSGIDLHQYAKQEKELHSGNFYVLQKGLDDYWHGRRKIRFAFNAHCDHVRIWAGAMADWEQAFAGYEPTLDTGPHILTACGFGLRYLFDGFVTDEDIERKRKQRDKRKQLTLARNIVTGTSSGDNVWIWWLLLAFIAYIAFTNVLYYRVRYLLAFG